MSIFEDNIYALKQTHSDLYEAVMTEKNTDTVQVGKALNGEKFLAVEQNASWIALDSIYHPTHAAERFVNQFGGRQDAINLVIFGLGSGNVLRTLLQSDIKIETCIVVEPSLGIIRRVIEEFDLQDIIRCSNIRLFVSGINDDNLSSYLDDVVRYDNWRSFFYVTLPGYSELYDEAEKKCFELYKQILVERRNDQAFLQTYAGRVLENEIHAMGWLIHAKSAFEIKPFITAEIPCIIVAAGPSLEKNIEELRRAKGKSMILAVDSAVNYLIQKSIVPDMICTVDPIKSDHIRFELQPSDTIPIAVTTSSDYRLLKSLQSTEIVCFSADNEYHRNLLMNYGWDIPYVYGGASVATNCCELALKLGFRTIILVGQDLAIQGERLHAGIHEEKVELERIQVDGYNGGKVLTLPDFKMFLDWYQRVIAKRKDTLFINATEGGAKIIGAYQMPLSEAIDQHCKGIFRFEDIYHKIPYMWPDRCSQSALYQDLQNQAGVIEQLYNSVEKILDLYNEYSGNDVRKKKKDVKLDVINHATRKILQDVADSPIAMLLYKRMITTENEFRNRVLQQKQGKIYSDEETMHFMMDYFTEMQNGLEEMHRHWQELLRNMEFCF